MASEEALKDAREALKESMQVLERLAKAPLKMGTVIKIEKTAKGKRCIVAQGGGDTIAVEYPEFDINPGDGVLIEPEGGQILEKSVALPLGEPCTVLRLDGDRIETSVGGSTKLVYVGVHKLKEGDEILLDASARVVIHKVEFSKPRFAVTNDTKVTWNDIGGQREAKAAMREAVELPFKSPEIFKAYGKRPMKGILLSGPPGCGKTLLGKAAAHAIRELTGAKESGFLYIKGPEVLDPYVGVAEASVRKIFMKAKEHKAAHGSPAVVFVDEADAILGKRGTHHSFMEKTIVPAFLTEMDGMEESGALIILATNRPDTLDPAVVRDGRIDRKVAVTRPDQADSRDIFGLYLKVVPLCKGTSVNDLSEIAAEALFHEERMLAQITLRSREEVSVPLSALVSGALIAGIVDKAVSLALHRDIDAGIKKPTGITRSDIVASIVQTHRENLHIDHAEIIADVAAGREIIHTKRIRHVYAEAA